MKVDKKERTERAILDVRQYHISDFTVSGIIRTKRRAEQGARGPKARARADGGTPRCPRCGEHYEQHGRLWRCPECGQRTPRFRRVIRGP